MLSKGIFFSILYSLPIWDSCCYNLNLLAIFTLSISWILSKIDEGLFLCKLDLIDGNILSLDLFVLPF